MNAGLVSPITLIGYATQAVGAAILALLLLDFFRSYRQRYLRDWSQSWWALAVFNAATVVAIWASTRYGTLHPVRMLSSGASQVSAYWHLAWLLFGAVGIGFAREIPDRVRSATLVGCFALGATATLLFAWEPSAAAERLLLRYGMRSILAAAVFFFAAVLIWRVRPSAPRRGPRLISVTLALYGCDWLYNAAVPVLGIMGVPLDPELPSYLRIAEVFLVFLIGLGMVVWLLEDERERRKEGEDRFRTIAEAAFEGVSISAGGEIVDANTRLGEILRTDSRSLIGRPVVEFVAPESWAVFLERSRNPTGEPHEYLGLRADGTVFPAEVRKRAITYRGGPATVTVLRDLTLRKKAEREQARRARRESEERFRAFVETANDAIVSINARGEILLWNPAAEAIFGYREEEILGEPLTRLIPERFREAHLRAIRSRAGGEESEVLTLPDEIVGLRKDGSEFPAEMSLSAGEYDGEPLFNAILRDVSERRVAREALERLSRQHELLLNSAGEGIVGVGLEGIVSFANPASLALIGWRPHEVLGRSFHTLVHHSNEDGTPCHELECPVLEALRTGEGSRGETVYWRRDGSPFPVAYSCTPVEGDNVLGAVIVFEDITERREAERALRRSESKYRSLVEHATYGIYRSTPEGEFVAVNPALVDMLGYDSEEELLATNLAQEIYLDPGERERLVAQYEEARRVDALDLRWRRRGGEPITVRVSGRPLRNERGELEGFEMIAEDVTERRKLEEQLRQSQKMEAVGQFTGGIAHDFNNELSVILLNSELMAKTLEAGNAVERTDLDEIHEAAQRAARVTRQLLGFSRQAELRTEDTDLGRVVSGLSGMIRTVVPEMIDVRISADPKVSLVRVDRGVVEQILLNLVTNARDAMPRGGDLVIEVGEQEVDEGYAELHPDVNPGRYVFITVSDTGIGMDREVQARIFEPFFTTKPPGEGTGLGMAMVYGLTEQQDGHVHVYSELGQGTTIRIGFPVSEGEAASGVTLMEGRELEGGSETILLVEDEPAVRGTARRVLERSGYRVVAAADGEEGLNLYRKSPGDFDLVLSDLVMPKMGGLELYEALREEWGDVPFVLASGYAGRELEEEASLTHSIPFVQKPWRLADLLKRVREAIDAHGSTKL